MVYAGEKPGIGKYKCIQCGEIVELTSAEAGVADLSSM